ncbi:unnamed protein product [Gemmataceae bacterium]|nr:unnamed protein product [Gemmataceae bacterium]VTU00666.1 unnamed protein product [Gemmataceae bacterium]
MSITITDPALFARWAEMRGVIELKDPSGNVVGRIQTTWPAAFPKDAREYYLDHISDPDLLAKFEGVGEPVIVFDSQGYNIGRFERMWHGKSPTGLSTPLWDLDLERRSKAARNQKGYTLAEVWKIIYEKYVGDEVEPLIVLACQNTE